MNSIGSLFQSSSSSRLTGLSGFDSESIITSLMDAEKLPLTLLQQKRQVVEWRQEAYRDITATLQGVKSSFFDVLNTSSYMLSSSSIRSLAASSTSTAYVSATASADADLAAHLVKVNQLATADAAVSTGAVTKALTGSAAPTSMSLSKQSINITLDGTTRKINLDNYADMADMQTKLQSAIDTAFGTSGTAPDNHKIVVDTSSGSLSFSTDNGASKMTLSNVATGDTALATLGFTSGISNRISVSASLDSLSSRLGSALTFTGDNVEFSINGKSFSFSKSTSLTSVMNTVNADSTANVRMTYDEATDQLTIKAKQLGAGDNIQLSETASSFFTAFNIDTSATQSGWTQGQDANVTIDGETVVRSTNTFTLNGVSYTLNKAHDVADTGETVTVSQDVDKAVDKLTAFVEKYNSLIDTLYGKTTEKYSRDYMPLTTTQREAMSETEITSWETRAKTGLLQSDSILQKIMQDMRNAMNDAVEGSSLTLKDLGITSSSYQEHGKLTIDEAKLRETLQNQPDQAARLLNGTSEDVPSYSRSLSSTERTTRYNQSGLLWRMSDILENNISTIRDVNGKKGILLEKAGITGDLSATSNTIYKELTGYDDRIADLLDKLEAKEEAYYKKFSALETALQKMNEQSSWLSSQLGG